MRTMYDAAFPAFPAQVHTDCVLIYIGGDTPNPISDFSRFTQRYRMLAWVRSNPSGAQNGTDDAVAALHILESHNVPKGTCIMLDLEVAVDTAYVQAFDATMVTAGYKVTKYGSLSSIWQNPKTSGGTFVADPTGVSHMVTTGDCVATQWLFAGTYDLSLVLEQSTFPLWDTQSTTPPPPPPPKTIVQKNWAWCHKCQSLFYAPNMAISVCPAGNTHDDTGSGDYMITDLP